MSEFNKLESNIEKLTASIFEIKEIQLFGAKQPSIDKNFLTDRQVNKKIMTKEYNIDDETAHLTVYGKPSYKVNGKTVDDETKDPSIVDEKKAIPKTHPINDRIKGMKKSAANAVKLFKIRVQDIIEAFKQSIKEIAGASTAVANALVLVPPAPAIALNAIMSLITSITNVIEKITDLVPILDPLLFLPLLLPADKIDSIIVPINTTFTLIIGGLTAIETLIAGIKTIKTLVPIP